MSTKLEEFIQQHREELNQLEPSAESWEQLEKRLHPKKTYPVKRIWLQYAAAIAVLITVFGLGYYYSKSASNRSSSAYEPMEVKYSSLIELKRGQLKNIQKENPELYTQFSTEGDQLDQAYTQLKTELMHSPNSEAVLEAMLHNLQLQIDLLNRQLHIIQALKKKQDENPSQTI